MKYQNQTPDGQGRATLIRIVWMSLTDLNQSSLFSLHTLTTGELFSLFSLFFYK
jgi:hypothetical protein